MAKWWVFLLMACVAGVTCAPPPRLPSVPSLSRDAGAGLRDGVASGSLEPDPIRAGRGGNGSAASGSAGQAPAAGGKGGTNAATGGSGGAAGGRSAGAGGQAQAGGSPPASSGGQAGGPVGGAGSGGASASAGASGAVGGAAGAPEMAGASGSAGSGDSLDVMVVLPAADTYVQGSGFSNELQETVDNSTRNFGDDTVLLVKYRPAVEEQYYWREAFLLFDLPPPTSRAFTARLYLSARTTDEMLPNTVVVHGVDDTSWTETGMTWLTRPALGPPLSRAEVPPGVQVRVSLDVTSFVQQQALTGARQVALGLSQDPEAASLGNGRLDIDSREAAETGPTLVLTPAAD